MNFNINDFSGPLDVLLHMIKKHQMDIYEVDLKIIIEEYISFINELDKTDLDSKSEYLIMASELIHLKSKLLLGLDDKEDDDYEINSEDDLRNRLIEYEKYQSITNDFRILEENRQMFFTKVPEKLKDFDTEKKEILELDINDLFTAMMELTKRIDYKKPQTTSIMHKELSISKKTNYIKDFLKQKKKVEFTELFEEITKEEIVVTFLSLLEMSKKGGISIMQDKNFSKIFIEVTNE